MTRIIGGTARGRRLKAPPGDRTRPTSDRVREALFSSLDAELGSITGLRFLDLYAGSGAVGLEARSRGAGLVTLVEQDRRTTALIQGNLSMLGFTQVDVVAGPVRRVLGGPPRAPYDVAFLDPPYALSTPEVQDDLRELLAHGWVAEGSVVVVERGTRSEPLTWPPGLTSSRSRRYGETMLWYGHATAPGGSPEDSQDRPEEK